jgi:hypothetical protein
MEQSNGIKLAIIVIVAAGLMMTTTSYGQFAFADKDYELKGVGKGSISCPDGEKVKNARISFFVFYQDDETFAEWNVDQKNHGSQGGIITKESVTSSKYSLKGEEAFDNICDSDVPTKMSISGKCGEGSTAKLNADNGEKGTFKVRAKCTTAK